MQFSYHEVIRLFGFVACLALLPLIGANYGTGNQAGQLALIQRLVDPGHLVGDAFVDSQTAAGQPRFYFAYVMARLSELSSLPLAVHGSMVFWQAVLASGVVVAAFGVPGMRLSGALIAAFLATTSMGIRLGGAGYLSVETFVPANPAVALSVWALALMARGRLALGAIFGGLAAVFHPLIGLESALLGVGAAGLVFLHARHRPLGRHIMHGGMALFLLGTVFAVFWIIPRSVQSSVAMSDAQFFDILVRLRAPHHYLALTFPPTEWVAAIVFVLATGATLMALWRKTAGAPAVAFWSFLTGLVVLACAVSIVMVDLLESRLWATAQLFRTLMLLKLSAYIAMGWIIGQWFLQARLLPVTAVICVFWASHDAQAYVFAMVIVIWALDRPGSLHRLARWALALGMIFVTAYLVDAMGNDRIANRALLAALALALFCVRPLPSLAYSSCVIAAMGALIWHGVQIAPTGMFGENSLRSAYHAGHLQSAQADVARQAKVLSEPEDLWVLPPNHEGFRHLAGRPLLANLKSVPFDDASILKWAEVAQVLYGVQLGQIGINGVTAKAYYASGRGLLEARDKFGADFAVLLNETSWPGPVLYQNSDYKIVSLKHHP